MGGIADNPTHILRTNYNIARLVTRTSHTRKRTGSEHTIGGNLIQELVTVDHNVGCLYSQPTSTRCWISIAFPIEFADHGLIAIRDGLSTGKYVAFAISEGQSEASGGRAADFGYSDTRVKSSEIVDNIRKVDAIRHLKLFNLAADDADVLDARAWAFTFRAETCGPRPRTSSVVEIKGSDGSDSV